jgi:hypothetical protein
MSYPHSKSMSLGDAFPSAAEPLAAHDNSLPYVHAATDGAMDVALRSVPLPEGLLGRLKQLALTIADEAAGPVDYLGC